MANPRQSVDEYGKQVRPRSPAAASGREAADELESTQNHASPVRQQLQAQFALRVQSLELQVQEAQGLYTHAAAELQANQGSPPLSDELSEGASGISKM